MPTPLDNGGMHDALPPLSSHNSQPEITPANLSVSRAPLKRNSSSAPGFRHSTLGVPSAKKRLSGIGVASSHGRLFKVLADFFLLAGRTEEALVWCVRFFHFLIQHQMSATRYTEAILLFKLPQDTIWHASAMEGMATLSILEAWSAGHGLVRC